jgi:hypothetical protein
VQGQPARAEHEAEAAHVSTVRQRTVNHTRQAAPATRQ